MIGAIGMLRDMRAYEEVVRDLEQSKTELQEKILDLEKFEEVVVGRELKMIALEKELEASRTRSRSSGPTARELTMSPSPTACAAAATPRPLEEQIEQLEHRVRAGGGAPPRAAAHHGRPERVEPASSATSARRCSTSSRTRTGSNLRLERQPQGDDPHHGRPA